MYRALVKARHWDNLEKRQSEGTFNAGIPFGAWKASKKNNERRFTVSKLSPPSVSVRFSLQDEGNLAVTATTTANTTRFSEKTNRVPHESQGQIYRLFLGGFRFPPRFPPRGPTMLSPNCLSAVEKWNRSAGWQDISRSAGTRTTALVEIAEIYLRWNDFFRVLCRNTCIATSPPAQPPTRAD